MNRTIRPNPGLEPRNSNLSVLRASHYNKIDAPILFTNLVTFENVYLPNTNLKIYSTLAWKVRYPGFELSRRKLSRRM